MSLRLRRYCDVPPSELDSLEAALTHYYQATPACYYEIADETVSRYGPESTPLHWDVLTHVSPSNRVLELGCGTAHFCPNVESRGGLYTGIDHGTDLLERNQSRYPTARFCSISTKLQEQFDLVVSLYTLEHVVRPLEYLERMWDFCEPGGKMAVICPEFIDIDDFPPSFIYGATARRFREKIRTGAILDAAAHIWDLCLPARTWKTMARREPPGAFWINQKPWALNNPTYHIDADAVHLTRLSDVVAWFEGRGATILRTSRSIPAVAPEVIRYNMYVLAQKPQT